MSKKIIVSKIENKRLWGLMRDKGFIDVSTFAKELYKYITFNCPADRPTDTTSYDYKRYEANKELAQKKIIKNLYDSSTMDFNYLSAYCKFFNCSADYLLGSIDLPTHKGTDINTETGLSNDAIETLKTIAIRAKIQLGGSASKRLDTLNYILKDGETFEEFLSNLALYIDNNYKTPLYRDPDKQCYVDVSYVCANGERGMAFGYQTKDNKGNDGYESIGVSVDILESHAMLKMQEIMNNWKRSYKHQKGGT